MLPTTYLGLHLGANHKVESVWDVVEKRFRQRLALWKRQYISKGGRLTLIRSTLSNMPIYFMSLLWIPRKVKMRLEKIQREFLWGGGALKRKIHLVKWKTICSNKDKGGLGVKCLGTLNKALLAKWDNPLWKNIISLKYGVDKGGWFTKNGRFSFGVGLWKEINKEATVLRQFSNCVVEDGKCLDFWKDTWCGTEPLSEAFHNIYTLSTAKDVYLEDIWDWSREEGGWNPTFLWSFND